MFPAKHYNKIKWRLVLNWRFLLMRLLTKAFWFCTATAVIVVGAALCWIVSVDLYAAWNMNN